MKNFTAALATHYQQDRTTLAYALKITREDGEVFGFTSHDKDVTIDGVSYDANQGLDITSIVTTAGFAVGNLQLTTINDGSLFTRSDVLGGLWKNAAFNLFRYNWDSPPSGSPLEGIETLLVGTIGEGEVGDTHVTIELRDLRQYLQQPVESVSSKTCRYRFGDSLCGVDLNGSPTLYTFQTTVTTVTSNQIFVCSGLNSKAENYFTEGEVRWLTGANSGMSRKVKTFLGVGSPTVKQITLALPMFANIAVGDTLTIIAGCRKRLEDCISFNNVLNFGGEPHRPGVDNITEPVRVDV